jgi:drug/metabolite transporter (DMT)-like permease
MWLAYALGASIVWGLVYVLSEQLYRILSVPTVIAMQLAIAALIATVVALATGTLRTDIGTVLSSRALIYLLLASIAAWLAADFLIAYSIVGKSATLAGLVEISYPLFIALFAYLIFGEAQLSLATALGGALIFAGVAVIFVWGR